MQIPFIEKSFHTPSGDIHYWMNEHSKDRLCLVFLPGLTATHKLFAKQLEYFKDQYNVLAWDAPSHGASRPFALTYSMQDKAEYLHSILELEGIQRFILIGQSMGGYVSQAFIQQYPKTAAGFICVDSASLRRKYMTSLELWLLKRMEPVYAMYPWKLLVKTGAKGCAESEYGRNLMQEMMNGFDSQSEYSALAGHGYKILAEAVEKDLDYSIDCPFILVCGSKDKAGSTKRYNRRWAEEEKAELIWLAGAGHNSNTDKPEEFNRIVEDFIKKYIK